MTVQLSKSWHCGQACAPFSLQVSLLLSSFSLLCLTRLGPQPGCLLCLFSVHLLASLSCSALALLLRCMVPVHHLQEHTVKSQTWLGIWPALMSVSVCVQCMLPLHTLHVVSVSPCVHLHMLHEVTQLFGALSARNSKRVLDICGSPWVSNAL